MCRNHRATDLRATYGKGGAAAVVLSHSARLNAKKFARVTDETHPASLVGSLAITTFPVITTQVSETDFHATSAAIGRVRACGPRLLALSIGRRETRVSICRIIVTLHYRILSDPSAIARRELR